MTTEMTEDQWDTLYNMTETDRRITVGSPQWKELVDAAREHAAFKIVINLALDDFQKLPGFENYTNTGLSEFIKMAGDKISSLQASLEAANKDLEKLKAVVPIIDGQGVRFGNAWVSFDRLAGWNGTDGPERDKFYKERITAKAIMAWVDSVKAPQNGQAV